MQGIAMGQPVVQSAPKTRLAKDILHIARQLAGVPSASRSGWLPWRRRRTAMVTA
jgi:Flp pilus assembly CpaE family ATPase